MKMCLMIPEYLTFRASEPHIEISSLFYSISEDEKKGAFIGSFRILKSAFLRPLVIMIAEHWIKYARIRVFTDPYFPYAREYGSVKTRILTYFMQ